MHIGKNAAQFSALGASIRPLAGTASADCLPSIIDDLNRLMTDQTTISPTGNNRSRWIRHGVSSNWKPNANGGSTSVARGQAREQEVT